MEAAFRRLCQGDTSRLSDILDCIEARQAIPSGQLRTGAYTALVTLLVREGRALSPVRASESVLPSEEAFHALRILAILGARAAEEGYDVKSILLSLGIQKCRDMNLDAYLAQLSSQRRYAIMFVMMLVSTYGCSPQDFLKREVSLNVLSGSADSGEASPLRHGTSEYNEHHQAPLQHVVRGAAATANSSGALALLTCSTDPRPPPVANSSASSPRSTSIEYRSTHGASIPPVSGDLLLQPARRYRNLPAKPSSAPYPVNPLYVGDPLCEGSACASTTGERVGEHDAIVGASPRSPPLAVEILLTAQFPAPVVQFSAYYGVGCVPRLPTIDNVARLGAWRKSRQPRHFSKSEAKASSSPPLTPARPGEWGKISDTALHTRPLDAAVDNDTPDPFAVRNEMAFVSSTCGTSAYHHMCLGCSLLQQYMGEGMLMTWGSMAKGALGSHSFFNRRHRPGVPSGGTAFCDHAGGSMGQVDDAASVSIIPTGENPTVVPAVGLNGHTNEKGSVKGKGSATVSFPATLRAFVARGRSAADNLPETRLKAQKGANQVHGCPSSDFQNIISTTSAGVVPVHAASPDDTSAAGYASLPLPIYTPVPVAQVACGLGVTYIVTVDGGLYSCGRAENGQLGIGSCGLRYANAGVNTWQQVLFKEKRRVTRIAAGTACAVALAGDSALYCWGHNVYGQCLAMPDTSRVLSPVQLQTEDIRVLDVCFGQFFGMVLFQDGVIGTWGIASMLGCKAGGRVLKPSLAPDQYKCARQIVRLQQSNLGPMAAVRAGPWHALAISQRGEVYTWGVGRNGRLGHGTDSSEVEPRLVEGLRSFFVVDASCSYTHSAVLTSTGAVYVFGENTEGQLGLRGCEPRRLPTLLPLPLKAVSVSCAREHTCILLADGDVVACGSYRTCGIGLGYGSRLCAPVRILTNYVTLMLHSSYLQGVAGVVRRGTALMAIGHSTIDEVFNASRWVVHSGVRCAASGVGFLVVVSENDSLVAIGRGDSGQLGIGDCMRPTHSDDVTVASTFREVRIPREAVIHYVRCGPDFVLALDDSGVVYGWGSNNHRTLCQPAEVTHVFSPVRIAAYTDKRVVQIGCGGTFVVALTADGEVLTHGEGMYCGLGEPMLQAHDAGSDVPIPTRVDGLSDVVAVAAGLCHAVAMTVSCTVFAWGAGVLGNGCAAGTSDASSFLSVTPTPVRVALTQTIRSIGCGPHSSFAISDEGELWVWGINRFGECGMPTRRISGNAGGDPVPSLGIGQVRDSDEDARSIGTITAPTVVARQVRDASFTAQFGVVVFEDGQVRVSGRISYAGQSYLLPSFYSTPQPLLCMNVKESMGRPPQLHCGRSVSLRNDGGGASSCVAGAQGHQRQQRSTDMNSAAKSEEAESVPSHAGFQAKAKTAKSPAAGRSSLRPRPPSLRQLQELEAGAVGSSPNCACARKLSLHSTSPMFPVTGGACSSPVATFLSTSAVAGGLASHRTPKNKFSPSTTPGPGADDATAVEHRQETISEHSFSAPSRPAETGQRRGCSPRTAVAVDGMGGGDAPSSSEGNLYMIEEEAQPDIALAEANCYGSDSRAPEPAARLSSAEGSSQVDMCTRIPPCKVSDRAPLTPMQAKAPGMEQPCRAVIMRERVPDVRPVSPPSLQKDPPTPSTAGTSRTAVSRGVTDPGAAARGPLHGLPPPPPPPPSLQQDSCNATVKAAVANSVPLAPSLPSPRPRPPPLSASEERIFGVRCFAGWENISLVVETRRPSVQEVCMAQTGLQVLLHQTEGSVRRGGLC